jgi:glycosyltransferase involved in cell wall biosynthesis
MRVAIVHDYLTQRGGAERVVLAIARAFPDAPIHTSLYDPDGTFPGFADLDVRPSAIDRLPGLRRHHRLAFPLLAPTFSRMRIDADVVICSSSGWAHGVSTTGGKLVYCYNPARWLYQAHQYSRRLSLTRLAGSLLGSPLRSWDRRAARSADAYVTISTVVQRRIEAAYGIRATILPPPPGLDARGPARPVPGLAPGFVLCVSRLLPYKNVDAVVRAFAGMPDERLAVVGDGPDRVRLRSLAGPNVDLLGSVDDATLRWLYANSRGVVAASYEDLGLTPIEAAAFGRPSAVLRWGGFLDTVEEGRTGVFFDRPDPEAIADGVRRILARQWATADLDDLCERHAPSAFECAMQGAALAVAGAPRAESRP